MPLLQSLVGVFIMTAVPQAYHPVAGAMPTQSKVVTTLNALTQQASINSCQDAYSYRTVGQNLGNIPTFLYQKARAIYPAAPKVEIHVLSDIVFEGKGSPQKLYYFKVNSHNNTFVHFYRPVGQLYQVYGYRLK